MDNNRFLENGDIDKLITQIIDEKFNNNDSIEIDGKSTSRTEYERKLFEEMTDFTRDVMLKDIFSYSNDQRKYYDQIMNYRKNKIKKTLQRTLASIKNMILKSIEIGEYLATNSGVMTGGEIHFSGNEVTKFALIRIHESAIHLAGEITVLIENGFSDGAEARWRTLNEYSIIASVLSSENRSDLSVRYVEHYKVGLYRTIKKFMKTSNAHSSEYDDIKKDFDDVKVKFGKDYVDNDYGWYDINPKIGIQELAEKYHNSNLLGYIQESNLTVHATSYKFDRFLNNEFKDRINSLEIVVQNLAISLSLVNQILILHFGKELHNITVVGYSIVKAYNAWVKDISRLFFEERSKIDKDKPKLNEFLGEVKNYD